MKPIILWRDPDEPIDFTLYPRGFPDVGEVWELNWEPSRVRLLFFVNLYNEWHWECLDLETGEMRYPSVECWIKRNVSSYEPTRIM